jgi:hypothetical protein
MELYTIIPSSSDSADCDPIVLRETSITRLVFKPQLVNNARDASAPLRGTLIFQRKGPSSEWEEYNEVQLNKLKAQEWVRLDLKPGEIHRLMTHAAALYRVYQKDGIPRKKVHFLKIDLSEDDIDKGLDIGKLLQLGQKAGVDLLTQIVEWSTQIGNASEIFQRLEDLDISTLQRLNSLVGITSLKAVLSLWESNEANDDEEFWQKTLSENAFVLSQVFSFPLVIIEDKAYVGGKIVDNSRGHLADFLAANSLTKNSAIIEIKTPQTKLLGKKYRADIYSASEELSGAIIQVLNYRYSLSTDFLSIRRKYEDMFDVFSPHCLVIAGHLSNQLTSEDHRRSFELIRNNLKDVLVLTYDELFGKIKQLIDALEGVSK